MYFKKNISLFLIILFSTHTFSCLNVSWVKLNGQVVKFNNTLQMPFSLDPQIYIKNMEMYNNTKENLHLADSMYQLTKRIENYSDLGVALVRDKQYKAGKKIFLEIEKTSPGLYATAANLGTTYELLGKNDSALFWIKKAVSINPHSHQDSEWIHVKILEAKNRSVPDPYHYNILSLDFGTDKIPENVNSINLVALDSQLTFQLEERIFFVKPKDPVMGQLFFQLGNIYALTSTVKSAAEMYDYASEYGYTDDLMNERKGYFIDLQDESEGDYSSLVLKILRYVFLTGILAYILIKYIRKRKK